MFVQQFDILYFCANTKEVYFLSRTGAIETLVFDESYVVESQVNQQEFSTTQHNRNFYPTNDKLLVQGLERQRKGGTTQYAAKAKRSLKLVFKAKPTKNLADYLESFLTSELRYLRHKYDPTYGTLHAEPITVEHSTSEIDKKTGLLNFEVTISYDSTDLKW